MSFPELHFLIPGNPLAATGGYEYDRRIIEGLRHQGWTVHLHTLDASFPTPTTRALDEAQQVLAALPLHSVVLIDGLALGGMPEVVRRHAERLRQIALVHHPLAAETGLHRELAARLAATERDALQAVRRVIVTSHATGRALDAFGVTAQRIAVVEPGVDHPVHPRAERNAQVSRRAGPVRLLCVATITPRKGHDLLVGALAGLQELDWNLTCVGDFTRSPETAQALLANISAAGLQQRVVLSGELDAVALGRQFADADVFVLATHHEGYGMAVAQALTWGLPVISTHTGAIPDLVPPEAGLLVEPGDSNAFREALASVLLDPGLRLRLAAGAVRAGAKLPDWSAACRRFSEVLFEATEATPDLATPA